MATNERRQGMESMQTDIALIKQKAEFIEEKLNALTESMESVRNRLETSQPLEKKDLDAHALQDRWLFGFMMTVLLAILGALLSGQFA